MVRRIDADSMTRKDAYRETLRYHARDVAVVRGKPDGSWKLIMGDPNGRE